LLELELELELLERLLVEETETERTRAFPLAFSLTVCFFLCFLPVVVSGFSRSLPFPFLLVAPFFSFCLEAKK